MQEWQIELLSLVWSSVYIRFGIAGVIVKSYVLVFLLSAGRDFASLTALLVLTQIYTALAYLLFSKLALTPSLVEVSDRNCLQSFALWSALPQKLIFEKLTDFRGFCNCRNLAILFESISPIEYLVQVRKPSAVVVVLLASSKINSK